MLSSETYSRPSILVTSQAAAGVAEFTGAPVITKKISEAIANRKESSDGLKWGIEKISCFGGAHGVYRINAPLTT
jgi:UDP-N-acetylglucosamine:LPS N-acetylglucosamine transferase